MRADRGPMEGGAALWVGLLNQRTRSASAASLCRRQQAFQQRQAAQSHGPHQRRHAVDVHGQRARAGCKQLLYRVGVLPADSQQQRRLKRRLRRHRQVWVNTSPCRQSTVLSDRGHELMLRTLFKDV